MLVTLATIPAVALGFVPGASSSTELHGRIGPFPSATLRLTTPADVDDGRFAGVVEASGRTFPLAPPDEPADLFRFAVKSVFFPRAGAADIVLLYVVSQIGPRHDADYRALVYAFRGRQFIRLGPLERRLEGVRDAGAARARLKGAR